MGYYEAKYSMYIMSIYSLCCVILQVKRPEDAALRAKLLKLYMEMGRINEAYTHAIEVERKAAYPASLDWYHCLLNVFKVHLSYIRYKQNSQI